MSNSITIPLSRKSRLIAGKYEAMISLDDKDLLEFDWSVKLSKNTDIVYAHRRNPSNKTTSQMLHRLILSRMLDRPLGRFEYVDHKDRNGLNNCRENLRLSTPSQNSANQRLQITSSQKYKGVTKQGNLYRAQIVYQREHIHIGYYKTPEEAHEAYCFMAEALHGEFWSDGRI